MDDGEATALRQQLADAGRESIASRERIGVLTAEVASLTRSLAASRQTVANTNEFLGMVAHDLRSPLQVITLNTQVLLKIITTIAAGRPARKLAERIQHSTELLNHFVSDLLDVSSIETGQLSLKCEHQDVARMVEDACDILSTLCEEKGLILKRDIQVEAAAEVLCDQARFLQVMSNLVGNAIKFTDRGGEITVGASQVADEFAFSVKDTGAGISEDELPHMFEKHWKPKRSVSDGLTEGGFGLGLAIVKNLVEAQGGVVSAVSKKNQGSTFRFTLPREPRKPHGERRLAQPEPPTS